MQEPLRPQRTLYKQTLGGLRGLSDLSVERFAHEGRTRNLAERALRSEPLPRLRREDSSGEGHEFGLRLSADEKRRLIAFLKTL